MAFSLQSAGRMLVRQRVAISCPVRCLNLHEDQSKALMQKYNVKVQNFRSAETAADAEKYSTEILKSPGATEIVLKALVHAGGRGKGTFSNGFKGGVKLSKNPKDIGEWASKMLGYNLVTKQTPPDGVKVNRVMVAQALDISRETYLAIVMDRAANGPVLIGSPQGGMDIEEVAEKSPELMFKEIVDIKKGVTDEQATRLAGNLKFQGKNLTEAAAQIKALYNLFIAVDATQVEVNPFGETTAGDVVCFDAKINFDDNAEFRQKDIFAQRDPTEEDPRETAATAQGLNYVQMDGDIACMVNGAGLAMATMDIIKLNGGEPANFLDCGGTADAKRVTFAFKLLTADPKVKGVLVNIFGGIVDCCTIADGIIIACKEVQLKLPLVVRLEGTNVDKAKKMLKDSGLPIISADNLDDAATKIMKAIKAPKCC